MNENDKLVLIALRLLNCIFDSHSYTYKVSDFDNYDWKCLFIEDLKNFNVTQVSGLTRKVTLLYRHSLGRKNCVL